METVAPPLPDILAGCKVFPCKPMAKVPATARGWKDASSDPEQIAAWHQTNPNFNWAVACGLSGLYVLDIDPSGLDWWNDILKFRLDVAEAAARAYKVRTPRGGFHYYWQGDGPSTASRIAPGIDTRGAGGYVVLPGSQTPQGRYEALGGALEPIPACIRALMPERKQSTTTGLERDPDKDQPRNVAWATELLKGYVQSGRVSIEGEGGNHLAFSVAASVLDKAISPARCLELLLEHWNEHCQPPWEDWELEIVVRNAAEYSEEGKTGAKGFQSNQDAFAAFAGMEIEPARIETKDRVQWIEDYAASVADPSWLIPNVLPANGIGMIYGHSGSYKSFLALDMALCLSHGVAGQWGAAPVVNDVLYLAGEGPIAAARKRRPAWREWQKVEGKSRLAFYPRVPFYSDTERWEQIKIHIEEMGARPRLIVLDTLTRLLTGMDENNTKDATMATGFMEDLARYYECFVLAIHHTGKDESKGARGSSAFFANMDTVLYTKLKIGGTEFRVKKQKDADVPDEPWLFKVKEVASSIVLEKTDSLNEPAKAGRSRLDWASADTIMAVLQRNGGKLSHSMMVQEIAGEFGIDRDLVRRELGKADLQYMKHGQTWEIVQQQQEWDL